MKKQVKKISKKIMVLVLATSIIFTTCFSHKKINAHATSIVAGLGAYTLYEICLYIGGLAVTTLGIGYAYENRDEIAELGKNIIDKIDSLSSSGWILGSSTVHGDYVYGTEALEEVQETQWTVIQGGGQSPKNDNDDDGDEDLDDRELELNLNGYFLTQAGINLFENHIKPLYEKWVNNEKEDVFNKTFGVANAVPFTNITDTDGDGDGYLDYFCYAYCPPYYSPDGEFTFIDCSNMKVSSGNRFAVVNARLRSDYGANFTWHYGSGTSTKIRPDGYYDRDFGDKGLLVTNLPIFDSISDAENYVRTGDLSACRNLTTNYNVKDWISDDNSNLTDSLTDIGSSLRPLSDVIDITDTLTNDAKDLRPSADAYADMVADIVSDYVPISYPITEPIYYPATNPTPKLDPSEFPYYEPSTNPDIGGGTDNPDNPDDGDGGGSDEEIDLDGLGSIFSILFYLIMIIIMLIYLFLACLAFIVMIFRIPASSSMLPEEMVMGFDHLKTIMIPGMNISIYGFAMALIYLLIIFTVIKILRLEINDFKFPRAGRKP